MFSPEMGFAFSNISGDLGSKLQSYSFGLQQRYGDPRVYAMQRDQMRKDEASVQYGKDKGVEELLKSARQTERNRETHSSRITQTSPTSSVTQPGCSPQLETDGRPCRRRNHHSKRQRLPCTRTQEVQPF